jgi:hypothetical protein
MRDEKGKGTRQKGKGRREKAEGKRQKVRRQKDEFKPQISVLRFGSPFFFPLSQFQRHLLYSRLLGLVDRGTRCQFVGVAGGFGQAIFCGTAQGVGNGGFQADPMPWGHIDGFGFGAGSQGNANGFSLVNQGLPTAAIVARFSMATDQPGFANSDRGAVEQ